MVFVTPLCITYLSFITPSHILRHATPHLHQGGAVLKEAQDAVADVSNIAAHLEVEVNQVGV